MNSFARLKIKNQVVADYPELVAEYDHDKNRLPVDEVLVSTKTSLWWKCSHGHEWRERAKRRVNPKVASGCIVCEARGWTETATRRWLEDHIDELEAACVRSRTEFVTWAGLATTISPGRIVGEMLMKRGPVFDILRDWLNGVDDLISELMEEHIANGRAPRRKIKKSIRISIYKRDGYKCQNPCCRGGKEGSELTLDHMEPHSLGGSDHPDNLITLCRLCNGRKGDRLWDEFMERERARIEAATAA